jgi:hypothetical protein
MDRQVFVELVELVVSVCLMFLLLVELKENIWSLMRLLQIHLFCFRSVLYIVLIEKKAEGGRTEN